MWERRKNILQPLYQNKNPQNLMDFEDFNIITMHILRIKRRDCTQKKVLEPDQNKNFSSGIHRIIGVNWDTMLGKNINFWNDIY